MTYSFADDRWLDEELRKYLEGLFATLAAGEYWFSLDFGEKPCPIRLGLLDCWQNWRLN